MKKKLIIILILACICMQNAFSAPQSAMIKITDDFYDGIDTLFLSLGKAISMTRPYSEKEARLYLESIADADMNTAERALYSELSNRVAETDSDSVFGFGAAGYIRPQIYAHTNRAFKDNIVYGDDNKPVAPYTKEYLPFDGDAAWADERERFMNIGLSLRIKETAEVHFEIPVMNTVHTLKPFGSEYISNNIPMVSSFRSFDYEDFNFNFPYRAYIDLGGSWWNLQIGREQYSYGSGVSGNFIIDKHVPYHNAFSVSVFNNQIKLSFLASFFPHPSQYYTGNTDALSGLDRYFNQTSDAYTGVKMLMDHRLEWTTKQRKSRMSIEEAIIYQSDKGILDMQILNPVMFFHNLYIAGNSNSILSLEWDYMFTPGIEQYVAIVIDDLNVPGEKKHDQETLGKTKEDAIGLQIGYKTAASVASGFIKTKTEFTYTSPALYLRGGLKNTEGTNGYNLNYVIAIRNQRSNHGIFDLTYIGYPYGCNTFNVLFDIEYQSIRKWSLGGKVSFNARGVNNATTAYDDVKPGTLFSSRSQYYILSSIYGSYSITEAFRMSVSASGICVWNMNNDSINNPFAYDLQFVLTGDYSF